ncbi:TPA: hypothetical protein ACSPZQ_001007 [Aeromonas veronii]|uniref:hypothetical protein n=1 Tax=Aeromonas veronii TaxID=654 RepID=UPI00224848D5|nr:hypothetical protein [Aeromonas veronii]EKP0300226.1 hypothetical protein [Aeromonas veronii]MCX0429675.1 hypothetical protein [Aeromonas veronii]
MEEEEARRCADTSCESSKNKAQQQRTEGLWNRWKPWLWQALGFLFMALPICITNWCDAILKVMDTYRVIFGP